MTILSFEDSKQLLMDYLSNTGKKKNDIEYRFRHSLLVESLAEKLIEQNQDLFPNKELNKEFFKACILHDIYKLDKGETHAHDAGILLMEMGFEFEIACAVMMHSDKHIPKENVKTISPYALLLQDIDIISKYNLETLKIRFGKDDLGNEIYELFALLKSTEFYTPGAQALAEISCNKMMHDYSTKSSEAFKHVEGGKLKKMQKFLRKKKKSKR